MPTIFCIGKNYAAHAREMGSVPDPTGEPVVFLKPWHALVAPPGPIRFLEGSGEIHHEAEVVLRVGPRATVDAIALGLDLTDRTRQADARKHGLRGRRRRASAAPRRSARSCRSRAPPPSTRSASR